MAEEIKFSDLEMLEVIGKGGNGIVKRGKYCGTNVAIKQYLEGDDLSEEAKEEFLKEAQVMGTLRFPHIVQFIGYCTKPYAIVMDFFPKGSLQRVLKSNEPLDWRQRIQIALEIASGLKYLHHKKFLHRDLKSSNVLLTGTYQARLCDFGLALVKTETTKTLGLQGTPQWMAPELFKRKPIYSNESDIYALGVVYWEISSRKTPYAKDRIEAIISFVKDGEREDIPPDCPESFAKVIQQCWDGDPGKRPDIDSIINALSSILLSLTNPEPLPLPIDEIPSQLRTKSFKPPPTPKNLGTALKFNPNIKIQNEGGNPNGSHKKIINDQRKQIEKTDTFPASVHGVVKFDSGDGISDSWGSGTLIAPDLVLTAAHNIYNAESPSPKKKYQNITFIPGIHEDFTPFGEIEIKRIFVPKEYIHQESHRKDTLHSYDYAILELSCPIGDLAGYFGLSGLKKAEFKNIKELQVIGYPGDKRIENGKFSMWGDQGPLKTFDPDGDFLLYPIQTYPGQSGSAVFYEQDGSNYIVGVHVASSVVYQQNIGIWLNGDRFKQIEAWTKPYEEESKSNPINNHPEKPRPTNYLEKITELKKYQKLPYINLNNYFVGAGGIALLSKSGGWTALMVLYLDNNSLGVEGAEVLRQNTSWVNLQVLSLNANFLGDEGVKKLSDNKSWEKLLKLKLVDNGLTDEGLLALTSNQVWVLQELDY